jgi:hypothetical protein
MAIAFDSPFALAALSSSWAPPIYLFETISIRDKIAVGETQNPAAGHLCRGVRFVANARLNAR